MSIREKTAFPFQIVSLGNKQWQFYARNDIDRKEWYEAALLVASINLVLALV